MASLESDDDDVFVVSERASPSPKKYLRRLKKGVSRKSEADQACSSKEDENKPEILEKAGSCIRNDDFQPADLAEEFSLEKEFDDAGQMFVKQTDQSDEIESEMQEKPDDLSIGEEDESEDDGGDEDSQDEVDEDDEEAILNLLGKERKKVEQSTQEPLDDVITERPSADGIERTGKGTKRKGRMDELEEIHAQSQRLLRESTRVSFKPQQPARKSLSSVLDKIRSRKLQLAQGLEKKPLTFSLPRTEDGTVDVMDDGDVAMEFDNLFRQDHVNTLAGDGRLHGEAERNDQDESNQKPQRTVLQETQDHATKDNNVPSTSENHIDQCTSDNASTALFKSGDAFRAPMEDTQDLFSNSQLSHEEDNDVNVATALEEEVLGSVSQVNLHLDTETQDDMEHWPNQCSNEENLDPTVSERIEPARLATVPGVRALIDDEAEDEDEELVGLADEEEADEEGDLKDLVTYNNNEKAGDMRKRAELHRKWLEQQDSAMTDEILLKLKTGWLPGENRKRGLDFLDEDDDIFPKQGSSGLKQVDETELELGTHRLSEFPEDISQNAEASKDEDCEEETKIAKTCTAVDDLHESSDDDETEQKLLRQRLLEESEEQEEITLPADDETSREIFALINKVNVATQKKTKLGLAETRSFGRINSRSNSKSSFLRRTASSSLQPVQKQNSSGSGTRSFIFGRDDSNSGHGLSNGETQIEMEMKENLEPPQGSKTDYSETRVGGGTTGRNNQKSSNLSTSGPSLFDILKRQATDLDQALQNKNSNAMSKGVVPIFTAFKPNRSHKTPRGA